MLHQHNKHTHTHIVSIITEGDAIDVIRKYLPNSKSNDVTTIRFTRVYTHRDCREKKSVIHPISTLHKSQLCCIILQPIII